MRLIQAAACRVRAHRPVRIGRRRAFATPCDFIVTPTLPCTAPPIKPAALANGETGEPLLLHHTRPMHHVPVVRSVLN